MLTLLQLKKHKKKREDGPGSSQSTVDRAEPTMHSPSHPSHADSTSEQSSVAPSPLVPSHLTNAPDTQPMLRLDPSKVENQQSTTASNTEDASHSAAHQIAHPTRHIPLLPPLLHSSTSSSSEDLRTFAEKLSHLAVETQAKVAHASNTNISASTHTADSPSMTFESLLTALAGKSRQVIELTSSLQHERERAELLDRQNQLYANQLTNHESQHDNAINQLKHQLHSYSEALEVITGERRDWQETATRLEQALADKDKLLSIMTQDGEALRVRVRGLEAARQTSTNELREMAEMKKALTLEQQQLESINRKHQDLIHESAELRARLDDQLEISASLRRQIDMPRAAVWLKRG